MKSTKKDASNYNHLERSIAKLLTRFPLLKKSAKYTYSRLSYMRSKKNFKIKTTEEAVSITENGKESFFGYYDSSPSNATGLVTACITRSDTRGKPLPDRPVHLAVFGTEGNVLLSRPVAAYNWQQGCRAQWLSGDLIIYNDFDEIKRSYISHVISIKTGERIKTFDLPVQDSFGTDYFVSLNYQRLMTLRPDYGYRNLPELSKQELNNLEGDGLWKVDYKTGKAELIINLATAYQHMPRTEFKHGTHKFNHVMIAPNGKRFIFMHRCLVNGRRIDRLFLADATSGNLTLLADYEMVSHCFWVDDSTILGYMRGPDNVDAYWLIDAENQVFRRLPGNALQEYGDGHPHVYGDWFVTDTYPDKARMQHLLLCNWKTGEVKKLGEFFHGFTFSGESRCDLHPRFSPDGGSVYFDSVFTGRRQLYRMELPKIS